MKTWQYRAMLDAYRDLVEAGWPLHLAHRAVERAAQRAGFQGDGLGKSAQTRYLSHGPSGGPTFSPSGQCVRMLVQPGPGGYERIQGDLDRYQQQGWNVQMIEPFPGQVIYYACPPGQVPPEHQPQLFQAEEVI